MPTTRNYNNATIEGVDTTTAFDSLYPGGKFVSYNGNVDYTGSFTTPDARTLYSVLDNQTGVSATFSQEYGDYATLFSEESDGTVDVFVPQVDMIVMIHMNLSAIGSSSTTFNDMLIDVRTQYDAAGDASAYQTLFITLNRQDHGPNYAHVSGGVIKEVAADSYIKCLYSIGSADDTPRNVALNWSLVCVKTL